MKAKSAPKASKPPAAAKRRPKPSGTGKTRQTAAHQTSPASVEELDEILQRVANSKAKLENLLRTPPADSPAGKTILSNAALRETKLAERLVTEVSSDNSDVNALCETYKLKREELGRLTGFSLRALADWASDKLPSQPARRRLREVRRLLDALAEVVRVESIPQWLHQTNPEFAPLTPLQVIELGEIDRLWAMVYTLGSDRLD